MSSSISLSLLRPAAVEIGGSVLVIMSHPTEVPLKGRARVTGVVGVATALGYCFQSGKPAADVFSPTCNSLITIATQTGESNVENAVRIISRLCEESGVKTLKDKILTNVRKILEIEKPFVILKLEKIETYLPKFISLSLPYTNVFKLSGDRSWLNRKLLPLGAVLPCEDPEGPTVQIPPHLADVAAKWESAVKANGKSCLSREWDVVGSISDRLILKTL